MLKIRRSPDRLIFNMRIPIPRKTVLILNQCSDCDPHLHLLYNTSLYHFWQICSPVFFFRDAANRHATQPQPQPPTTPHSQSPLAIKNWAGPVKFDPENVKIIIDLIRGDFLNTSERLRENFRLKHYTLEMLWSCNAKRGGSNRWCVMSRSATTWQCPV